MENAASPFWCRAMKSPDAFQHEQQQLGKLWTFLGFETEIPAVNDWFRATLGDKSIFVQRFETGLRAFENRCAHRFYPLRTEEKGNGPIVCGFHHWRYNAEGLALGIPVCQEMFDKTPREMDARLPQVELAQCGNMIFGRFPGGPSGSLQEWLGDAFDILAVIANVDERHTHITSEVQANWKLMMGITLDDYHLVAVHPSTFGKKGYLGRDYTRYFRLGSHSAYLADAGSETPESMAAACREKRYVPTAYRIFQIFPTLVVSHVKAVNYLGEAYWFVLVQHLIPLAHDRTRSVTRLFPFPQTAPAGFLRREARKHAKFWFRLVFAHYTRKVHREDNEACEKLQSVIQQADGEPRLAFHETRIGWFEEEYTRFVGNPAAP